MMRDIPIDIAGQEIKIRSDEDEDYVRSLASFVDEKMREVGSGSNGVTTLNLALTAFWLALHLIMGSNPPMGVTQVEALP